MPNPAISVLAEAVQYNCHVSDARHGADDSLCIYLMKMREYFRWEKHLPYGASLEREQVGAWLQAREQLWEELEEAEMRPIEIDGQRYDPFDAEAINSQLTPLGLVYSGGLGNRAKPHFVLGALEQRRSSEGYSVFVVAREYARDLSAPPAMTLVEPSSCGASLCDATCGRSSKAGAGIARTTRSGAPSPATTSRAHSRRHSTP